MADRPRRPRPRRQGSRPSNRAASRGPGLTAQAPLRRRAAPERRSGYERPERRRRYDNDLPPLSYGGNGSGTHHPVSRVRYRGGEDGEDYDQYRAPRRSARERAVENWEYDI